MKNPNRFSFIKPENTPVFYGYIIAVAGTIGVWASIPGQSMGVSPFTDKLLTSLNISRPNYSIAYGVGTFLSSIFLSKAGNWFDKYGARWVSFFATLVLIISLLLFSRIDIITYSCVDFLNNCLNNMSFSNSSAGVEILKVLVFIINSGIPFLLLVSLFFILRFSGQGVLTMSSRNMIMKWFDTKRGRVNAFSSIFVSLGFSFSPRIINNLINKYTWQETWVIMGAFLAIIAIFIIIVFRDNPEDHNLKPDGLNNNDNISEDKSKIRKQYTLAEATKTRAFWMYTAMLSFNSFFLTGLIIHIESIYTSNGLDSHNAFKFFLPYTLVSVSISAIANYLSDKLKMKTYLYIMILGGIIAGTGLSILSSSPGIYILITGCGILNGFFAVLVSVAWPRFFGRKHLGEISGRTMSFIVAASAVAPAFFSMFDQFLNSYKGVGVSSIVFLIFVAIASRKAENPQ